MIHQINRKWTVGSYASWNKFYGKMSVVFVSTQRFYFKTNRKTLVSSKKRYWKLLKWPSVLKDRRIFMWQLQKILNIFTALALKQVFWKTKSFYEKLECHFLVEISTIENDIFHTKLPCQKPMLRQIEWGVQNGPITKDAFCNYFIFFKK